MNDTYRATVNLLLEVAPHVFRQPDLAMKGGTAINLFLRDMPRLSVDIDLVYTQLSHANRGEALNSISSRIGAIADSLKRIPNLHVQVLEAGAEADAKILVRRAGVMVKIELNVVFRGNVYPTVQLGLSQAAEQEFQRAVKVTALDPDELYASKLVAALDRQHPRDLFDVLHLYQNGGITPRMRRAFVVYLAGHNRPIHELLPPNHHDLTLPYEREFLGMTRNIVERIQLEEVRERLIAEFPSTLDDAERQFLFSLKSLDPRWSLLGLPHVEQLPAIQWKLLNLRTLSKKNPRKYQQFLTALAKRLES